MDRSPDDLLNERSLDDELPDEEPALPDGFPDGFHKDPTADLNHAWNIRADLAAKLDRLTDEEVVHRGWSINEMALNPRILRSFVKFAKSLEDAEDESKKTEPDEPENP